MSKASKSTSKVLSTWTPLNHEETNKKVFVERRELFCKWYEKWSEPQRKRIIADLLKLSDESQLVHLDMLLSEKIATKEQDFTRVLPRVLTVYIFSYLDPRTLCRCSQVCWFWKYLSELDQLWMMKCLRLGWNLPFSPGPFEHGLWKRNYVENLKSLQYLKMQKDLLASRPPPSPTISSITIPTDEIKGLSLNSPKSVRSFMSQQSKLSRKVTGPVKPAWRGSDPNPKDTHRYNYLNNDDDVEIIKALRTHGMSGPKSASIAAKAKSKVKTGKNMLNSRSKSMTFDNESTYIPSMTTRSTTSQGLRDVSTVADMEPTVEDKIYGGRPDWAKPSKLMSGFPQSSQADNTLPSANSQSITLMSTPNRTSRDLPVSGAFDEFTQKPWRIPADHVDSD